MVIREQDIENAIDSCKCPVPMFCTVVTTCYEPNVRERTCLKCWLRYCKENNIRIVYEGDK